MGVFRTGALLSVAACALLASAAMAQDVPQPQTTIPDDTAQAQAETGADIVVTGSRIGRTGLTSTSLVTVLGRDDIALDRAIDIETVLTELPQFTGSFGAVRNGADAVADIVNFTLRDLRVRRRAPR